MRLFHSVLISVTLVTAKLFKFATHYSFGANRNACDGQCMYCADSHVHARWARIRELLSSYSERHRDLIREGHHKTAQTWHFELQQLLDWSWEKHQFECVPGNEYTM